MSYDEASFKAGLAVGRMLWRMPSTYENNTGLGWICNPAFLKKIELEWMCSIDWSSNLTRNYYKLYDGQAVAVFNFNRQSSTPSSYSGTDWSGPILISTEPLYVWYRTRGDGFNADLGPSGSFQYLERTWYFCDTYAFHYSSIRSYNAGTLPIIDSNGASAVDACIMILQAANVRVI